MASAFWSGDQSRRIKARVVVEGELVLQTPAHFGNGDGDYLTDMPLLLDPLDGRTPLLTGASIAGALRSNLRARQKGHNYPLPKAENTAAVKQERESAAVKLFGGFKGDDDGEQSPLIIDDAFGRNYGIELRDGVRISPESRTAANDAKFDLQLWEAGTAFDLRFELVICEQQTATETTTHEQELKQALATALNGLTDGEVTLGARKRCGYGRVNVTQWRVREYDLTKVKDLSDWIEHGNEPLPDQFAVTNLQTKLGELQTFADARSSFKINATFSLDGSLLIRSGSGQDDTGPDTVHLHARQVDGTRQAVLSGTSLAGALRARALKIANTLGKAKATALIERMFGKTERASKVSVSEQILQGATTNLVQNRVSIDRFTGGARDTALFNEQPAFGDDETLSTVDIRLINPEKCEIGLLLLLLKDLWTGDLPLGGESSVGRGRLKGKSATLTYSNSGAAQDWTIAVVGNGLTVKNENGADARAALETFVGALNAELKGATP